MKPTRLPTPKIKTTTRFNLSGKSVNLINLVFQTISFKHVGLLQKGRIHVYIFMCTYTYVYINFVSNDQVKQCRHIDTYTCVTWDVKVIRKRIP